MFIRHLKAFAIVLYERRGVFMYKLAKLFCVGDVVVLKRVEGS